MKRKYPPWRGILGRVLPGILLGLTVLVPVSLESSAAQVVPAAEGLFSSVSAGPAAAGSMAIEHPRLPAPGSLIFEDFKQVEREARTLLQSHSHFREDISPYRGSNSFDEIVRRFDAAAGFGVPYDDATDTLPAMTLQQRIDLANEELLRARDLYAFLAVFAPAERFRADAEYQTQDPDRSCLQPENPNPVVNPVTGEVADPIVDWCDFQARLRQSVREAVYLRMIFAQQFVVDAMGPSFSAGELFGGENRVREELSLLSRAAYQYDLAERSIVEAQGIVAGNGCYVADFFEIPEWTLLARIARNKEMAQHHAAVRSSYMNISSASDVARQHALARDMYRGAISDGYLKMVGMAGRMAVTVDTECASVPPVNELVSEMAAGIMDTRQRARQMDEGRNIFGFDLSFTPSGKLSTNVTTCGEPGIGLLTQARCAAEAALRVQRDVTTAERDFDLRQDKLITQVKQLNTGLDNAIVGASGCSKQGKSDEQFFQCIGEQIDWVTACDPSEFEAAEGAFDACIQAPRLLGSSLKVARIAMREAWLGIKQAETKRDNVLRRANIEEMRNNRVKSNILGAAGFTAANEAIIIAANCCTVDAGKPIVGFSINPGAFVEAALRPGIIMFQAASDMDVEDANSEAVVRNLFLDLAEAQIDIDLAFQQYRTAEENYGSVVSQLEADLFEAKRQRAYLVASPANDPSYRMVRDSRRLELADALDDATRFAYLAARRAEYEYAARLAANGFTMSDVYKVRTANDLLKFVTELGNKLPNLPGSSNEEINSEDFSISVVRHILGLTDQRLASEGFEGEEAVAERRRHFRTWVEAQTQPDDSGEQTIAFEFTTTSDPKGILGQVKRQGYDTYWLHKMAGIGVPKPENVGTGINLVTSQTDLPRRPARISQSGQVEMTTNAGCVFNYRLMPNAVMLGLDWSTNQPTDAVPAALHAGVNGSNIDATNRFEGRPVGAAWQVVIYYDNAGEGGSLDVQQLDDIELLFSTTFATRFGGRPNAADCVRSDF